MQAPTITGLYIPSNFCLPGLANNGARMVPVPLPSHIRCVPKSFQRSSLEDGSPWILREDSDGQPEHNQEDQNREPEQNAINWVPEVPCVEEQLIPRPGENSLRQAEYKVPCGLVCSLDVGGDQFRQQLWSHTPKSQGWTSKQQVQDEGHVPMSWRQQCRADDEHRHEDNLRYPDATKVSETDHEERHGHCDQPSGKASGQGVQSHGERVEGEALVEAEADRIPAGEDHVHQEADEHQVLQLRCCDDPEVVPWAHKFTPVALHEFQDSPAAMLWPKGLRQ
mmetsp:Transcript_143207/g.399197  ORF Transcript_143207/g.399197 Transcript_143207/m.399197 type:complete len:280 (+) Transcript_143207:192-1031(+)